MAGLLENKANLASNLVEVEVEAELGNKFQFQIYWHCLRFHFDFITIWNLESVFFKSILRPEL